MYHTSARQVADSFDTALKAGAMGLGAVLVQQTQQRAADRQEAAAIRRQAALIRARRITAEMAAERLRAEDDRMRDAILRRAILTKAKRARG